MDTKTALLNSVSFPLAAAQVEVIAVERDIDLDAEFSQTVGQSQAYQLAKADTIRYIVTSPNVSEGGVSISVVDRKTLIGIANGIYAKYGETLIQEEQPTVTPIWND